MKRRNFLAAVGVVAVPQSVSAETSETIEREILLSRFMIHSTFQRSITDRRLITQFKVTIIPNRESEHFAGTVLGKLFETGLVTIPDLSAFAIQWNLPFVKHLRLAAFLIEGDFLFYVSGKELGQATSISLMQAYEEITIVLPIWQGKQLLGRIISS